MGPKGLLPYSQEFINGPNPVSVEFIPQPHTLYFKIYFNITLPSVCLPFGFLTKLYEFLISVCLLHSPPISYSLI